MTRSFISEVESSSCFPCVVIMLKSWVIDPVFDFLIVLSRIISSPSTSIFRQVDALSSPCLRMEAPFCPGCNPKSANWSPSRIEVFPEPMSPESKTAPFGNSISSFS